LSLPDLPLASATEQVPSSSPLKQLSPSTDLLPWPGNYFNCSYYSKEAEDSLLWNDEQLGIQWGITNPVLAPKDQNAQKFSIFKSPFK